MHIQPSTVPVLEGLSARAADFDIILCDIWGVLHNGVNAYPSASKALRSFREAGGRVILVSNAPRPGTDVIGLLDGFGVDRLAYDGIVTSGDVTWSLLAAGSWKRYHWLGPKRDGNLFNGLPMTRADLADADVIVCTGLIDDRVETAETYRSFLEEALALGLPMVCANPDLVVERGGQIIHCAGAIANLYEELGGEAIYAGKPYPRIYDAALAVAASMTHKPADLSRTLMVGDAIRTDVAGAAAIGCKSLFVLRGIHMHELGLHEGALTDGSFASFLASAAFRPDFAIDTLTW